MIHVLVEVVKSINSVVVNKINAVFTGSEMILATCFFTFCPPNNNQISFFGFKER